MRKNEQLGVALGDQVADNVTQRMEVLRRQYGQRFAETSLKRDSRGKFSLPATVELLVLRSNEMDGDFENNPEAAPGLLQPDLPAGPSRAAQAGDLGFQDASSPPIMASTSTRQSEPGDVCAKPPGTWLNVHDRLLLGDGAADPSQLRLRRPRRWASAATSARRPVPGPWWPTGRAGLLSRRRLAPGSRGAGDRRSPESWQGRKLANSRP